MARMKILVMVLVYLSLFLNVYAKETKKFKLQFVSGNATISDSLSKKEVKKIFLGKKRSWDNRERILIVLNKSVIKEFYNFIGKSKSNYEKYWEKLIYTGKATEPIVLDNNREVIDYLKKYPNAISFISENDSLKCDKIKKLVIIK